MTRNEAKLRVQASLASIIGEQFLPLILGSSAINGGVVHCFKKQLRQKCYNFLILIF